MGEKPLDTRRTRSQGFDRRMVVAEPRGAYLAKQLHEARETEAKIVTCTVRLDNGEAEFPSLIGRFSTSTEVRGAKRAQLWELDPVRRGKERL